MALRLSGFLVMACRPTGLAIFSLHPHLHCNACAFSLWRE
ncbi:hypothetical protein CW298_0258 [Salmonella enterica subsp. enterica serovar Muenchen]|uniref:Uncharacterized protein n=7 Tax=Salmonella enterica I TaxID=59201 RepID=M7RL70_SALDU|nr:hypothetical protein SPAB_02877 [Salmonella enterica subsp. enterica serovar Paratyphi B str. SPB7]ACY87291.1 hypothetical protein STM14_0780 [Salmonella enterica subsp. enterica serovar Typhimurium str. 14028S]AEZ46001.1 hypothetical protein STBHUCCB_23280 [Salmonella enterica subsp. enterica serovar Typhi str. P-stx-12]AIE04612.1 hypothetical protein DC51_0703 [Salmonella enterica subsp. enterica serovar Typhimurium]APT81146.1 hypothetical protein GW13_PRO4274 [Salmonella enterica subsp. e